MFQLKENANIIISRVKLVIFSVYIFMLNQIRNLGKQTFVYGIGSILNKLLGFILIPIYQSHISINNFGNLVYFETIILFLVPLLNFGIATAHQRFFYTEHEKKTYDVFLFNSFFGSLVLSIISVIPMLIFSNEISTILCKTQGQSTNFQITLWIVIVEVMYLIPLQVLQYEQKPFQYLFYNAFKLILTFGLTIFFVLHYSMGIEGIMYARLAGGGITVVITILLIIIPRCTFKISFTSIKQSIKFGFPFVASTIGFTLFMLSDRFMLNWLSTSEQVGKYGFGMKIANFINLIFVQTIGISYLPSVMSNESKSDNIRYYRKMLTYYCFALAILVIGFLFFYKDILWIVGKNKEYWEGLKIVPILSLSYMVMGMNSFLGVGLFLKNQTKYYLIPSIAALIVNIGLNLFLIPTYGMVGAAISVLVAQVIYSFSLSYLSGKFLYVNFEWGKVTLIYLSAILIFSIGQLVNGFSLFIAFPIRLALMVLFPIALYKLNFFEAIEIQRIKDGLNKLRRIARI